MTVTFCIYHNNCADGFGAAWAVRKKYPYAVFYGANHGDAPPNVGGEDLLIVDFSYKEDVMRELAHQANSVTILDHHISAKETIEKLIAEGLVQGSFNNEKSGAMLAWDYCFPAIKPPKLLEYIQDRDLWTKALPDCDQVSAALFSFEYHFETWDYLMSRDIVSMIEDGVSINRKHMKDMAELVQYSARVMKIGGHLMPVANLPYTFSSEAGHYMAKQTPLGAAATYTDTPKGRIFSLRSIGDFDVSAIAKSYGGGGHKNAAGFQMPIGWEGDQ